MDRFFRAVLPVLGPDWGISVLGVLMMVLAADGLSRR